jgi:hypothetical protein
MGLMEELVGAVVAVEAAKKLDPEAGVFTEGLAAVVGFEGTKAIGNLIEDHKDQEENEGQK